MVRSPYKNFIEKRIGKRIDFDNGKGYQCVDRFKQCFFELEGKALGMTGNAVQIRNNTYGIFGRKDIRIPGTKDLMQGDYIFFNFHTTPINYFHVGLVDRIVDDRVFFSDQNGSKNPDTDGTNGDEITLRSMSLDSPYIVGIWRTPRIIQNRKLEMAFIKAKRIKLEKQGKSLDQNTIEYAESTIHKN